MDIKSLYGLKRSLNKCCKDDKSIKDKSHQEVPKMEMVGGHKSIWEKVVLNVPFLLFCCPVGTCHSLIKKPEQNL